MHEEVKSFMTGAASKYRLYQEQCLDVWINELAGEFPHGLLPHSFHTFDYQKLI